MSESTTYRSSRRTSRSIPSSSWDRSRGACTGTAQLGAHVLGYVGEVSDDELAKGAFPGARVGSLVGKFGVERTYNERLTGEDGSRVVLVDSLGREVGLLEEVDSVIGDDLQLTLDLELQTTAENLLAGKVGAIVAMDPRNGEILALASSPSFDPNSFSTRISPEAWNQLVNDPNRPLQNRAIQNAYPPGSVFKLIMAEAGLDEGLVDESTRVFCRGSALFYDRVFHCAAKQGHGFVNLEDAIARSCNIFFYELGRRLGISRIAEHAQALGLGERTGIDLPGERSGVMPSPEWKQQARGAKWYVGETISVSIGQGAVTTTPIQILRAVGCIATAGRLADAARPLARREDAADSLRPGRSVDCPLNRKPRQDPGGNVGERQRLGNRAQRGGSRSGYLRQDRHGPGDQQRTKKNSTANLPALEDHSWFVGFAGRDNPEIAVVVFVEHGGKGGIAAAPWPGRSSALTLPESSPPCSLPGRLRRNPGIDHEGQPAPDAQLRLDLVPGAARARWGGTSGDLEHDGWNQSELLSRTPGAVSLHRAGGLSHPSLF